MRINQWHVAKTDHRAVGVFGHCRDAGLDGAGETFGEIRIVHESYFQALQCFLDLFGLVTGDDNHVRRFRGERLFGHDPDQRLAAEFGQQLVGTAHPGRAPGRENDRRDIAVTVGGKTLARLRPRHDLHQ